MEFDRRYIVHDRMIQLLAREAAERQYEIDDNDPDAEEKRLAIKQQLGRDMHEFSKYFFGRKKGAECWLCHYREQAEKARIRQIESRWKNGGR